MEIDKSKRSDVEKNWVLLFINITNMSKINHVYGHNLGDVLLENTGIRIKQILRSSDCVFRFSGSQLAVLLTNFSKTTDIKIVCKKILESIAIPYNYKNKDLQFLGGIGVSIFSQDGNDYNAIIKNALAALEDARIRNEKIVFFNTEIRDEIIFHEEIENDIKKAFEFGQFELYYQPIVNNFARIIGAEALIRWNHPVKGLVSPMDFIPFAEDLNMIIPIGKWVIFNVCKQLKKWSDKYKIYISLNCSPIEFKNDTYIEVIDAALKNADNLDSKYLKIEITESKAMQHR